MVLLTNIDSGVSVNDTFIAQGINDCGQVELLKVDEEEVVCPDGVSFSSSNISSNVLAGCYDGTETVTLSDSHLLASNIKSGITIFGITGTFTGLGSIPGVNFTLGADQTSGTIAPGNYSGSTTATITSPSLLASNIKNTVNIFGVTGTNLGLVLPTVFANNACHLGQTHGPFSYVGGPTHMTAHATGVISSGSNLFLCYSSYYLIDPTYTRIRYTVFFYNGTTITTILNEDYFRGGTDNVYPYFTTGPGGVFYVVTGCPGGVYYVGKEVNLTTGATATVTSFTPGSNLSNTVTYGGLQYTPKLIRSTHLTDSRTGLACNVNINI